MGTASSSSYAIFIHLLILCCSSIVSTTSQDTSRNTLEIIIGGGGEAAPPAPSPEYVDCPPPPPPPPICSPPPLPPPAPPKPSPPSPVPSALSRRILMVYPYIKMLKERITHDPQKVTANWKGKNVCKYNGLLCDTVPGYNMKGLAGIDLNGKTLDSNKTGGLRIDDILGQLNDLVFFHVNSNHFTGPFPYTDIKNIPYFYELDFSNNKYTGPFPSQVLQAINLTFLDLRFNSFTGPLPRKVFNLDLDVLFLNNNGFTGSIPDNLGSTPVRYLTLAKNKFTGSIPASIGQASNTLLEVLFIGNSLSGCLPKEIGLLKKTTVFDVSVNKLTGPIPISFGCLKKIQYLNMSYNSFYATVPESVCKLPNLYRLTLNNNYFTQVGPECRKLMKTGKINVNMNCILDLPNQKTREVCAHFFSHSPLPCSHSSLLTYLPPSCKISSSLRPSDTINEFQQDQEEDEGISHPPTMAPEIAPTPTTYAALNMHGL